MKNRVVQFEGVNPPLENNKNLRGHRKPAEGFFIERDTGMLMNGPLRVVELFAGVGGFRLGLERVKTDKGELIYDVVWSNQWEPATKAQHASNIYVKRFGQFGHSNKDISSVEIGEVHDCDLLVGGFPCQDYSVAKPLSQANGILGKKGVLWWQIERILRKKTKRPRFLILENVDRLLKSPVGQRGRDFAIMLASLAELGYALEWRVINAADYGFPQRRRRVFIVGYHKTTDTHRKMKGFIEKGKASNWILSEGLLAKAFKVKKEDLKGIMQVVPKEPMDITRDFNKEDPSVTPFQNSGIMVDRKFVSFRTFPVSRKRPKLLRSILLRDDRVSEEFFVPPGDIAKWKELKGAKSAPRVNKEHNFEYSYSEGAMLFPDPLDRPSRTIVTGEGGRSPSRFKHVVQGSSGRLRRLTPVELEKLNDFPPGHTELDGISPSRRAFFMGNALVVGLVEAIGRQLAKEVRIM